METLYRARNWFASAPSVLVLLAAIILTALHNPAPMKKPDKQPPMRVTIATPPVEPPPMPAMPQLPEVTPEVSMPSVPIFTPRARPTPSPKAAPAPAVAPQEPAVTSSTPPVSAPPVAQPVPQPMTTAEDDIYATQVRAYLESIKHYPTSKEARLQRPRGTVNVWIVIDRSGAMREAGVEDSSGSLILDGAALTTVRGATYPGFPAGAFKGESTHRFTVQLNYSMN